MAIEKNKVQAVEMALMDMNNNGIIGKDALCVASLNVGIRVMVFCEMTDEEIITNVKKVIERERMLAEAASKIE